MFAVIEKMGLSFGLETCESGGTFTNAGQGKGLGAGRRGCKRWGVDVLRVQVLGDT